MWKKMLAVGGAVLVLSGCSLPVSVPGTSSSGGSIWKSSDSGQTFEPKVTIDAKQQISSSDILSLAFDPNDTQTIFAGSVENGIFKTMNGGEQWEHIAVPWQKIYSFVVDRRNPDRMFVTGVVDDEGKVFSSVDGGKNWKEVYTEPGVGTVVVSLAQHPKDGDVIFAGTSTGTVVKSTDGGDTWRNVGGAVDGPVTKIVFDATQPFSVYLLTFNQKSYYSSDGGLKWIDWEEEKQNEDQRQAIKNGQTIDPNRGRRPDGMVSLAPDPTISGRIYAGTMAKGLFVSNDFGKNWSEVNVIESAKKFPIRSVAINPTNSNEVIFAAGNAFYKTINNGSTWATVQLAIDRGVSVLVYDPAQSGTIYFGLRKY